MTQHADDATNGAPGLASGGSHTGLPAAFDALDAAAEQELLRDREERSLRGIWNTLLNQAMSLLSAQDGLVFDQRGKLRASPFMPQSCDFPLQSPAVWEGAAHAPRVITEAPGALVSHFGLPGGERLAIALVFAPDEVPLESGSSLLALLTRHATVCANSLDARNRVDMLMELSGLTLENLGSEAQSARTDGLTGLATHDFFQQRLAEELAASDRHRTSLSFMIFDLDHFKSINDTHGHPAGDAVLKAAAAMLKDSVRKYDLVARYGGEEFAIILPNTEEDAAYHLAERLRKQLEGMPFAISETRTIKVTASIGVACRLEQDVMPKDLIKRADVALYAAKNGGRNRVVLAQGPAVEAVNAIGAPRQGSHELFYSLARAFASAIEARIPLMYGHSETVGVLARRMGEVIGLPPEKQEALQIAGLLHDVGMMSVPERVIFKSGALDEDDWRAMREHPARGVALLAKFSTFSGLLEAVLYHHERWDGTGYPEGLQGSDIPLGARILSICDSYDAMLRGDYTFSNGRKPEDAQAEMIRCAGTQFDPELVNLFLRVLQEDPALSQLSLAGAEA
ncbi:MAG: diguanylate cyclase [Candidatus Sericytochromatia bacterium]|nr:diguanylate cyclase [Candidatus Sericytochromatia bacterium]